MPELPKRKTIRLKDYDYTSCGAYFITICTKDKKPLLSKITYDADENIADTVLTDIGQLVLRGLEEIERRFLVEIMEYVVMPDHVHFILMLPEERATTRVAPTVGRMIGALKSIVVHEGKKASLPVADLWQRNYYEHIIRNAHDLEETRKYITENPMQSKLEEIERLYQTL